MSPEQSRFVAHDADAGLRMERAIIGYYKGWLAEGDDAVDGGGADGWHSWGMASAVGAAGRVVTVEAIPWIAERIASTAQSWGLGQVQVVNAALSDHEGEAEFYIGENFGLSSLHRHAWLGESKAITVPLTTLDRVAAHLTRLRFIKLDIEGHEPIALRGAPEILTQRRPLVIFECGYQGALANIGLDASDLVGLWRQCGYELWDLSGVPLTEDMMRHEDAQKLLSNNVIATPDETAARFVAQRAPFVLANIDSFT